MRCVRLHNYGPASSLKVEEVEAPKPRAGEILVRVHAAAINPVDSKIRSGAMRGVVRPKLPVILGMDLSGVVEGVGAGVTKFKIGDELFSSPSHKTMGALADYVCLKEGEAAPKPKSIDHRGAASLPLVSLTAWASLVDHPHLKSGQRALIQAGAGGVGSIAIQLAKALGAEVLTTCSAGNAGLVRSLGADVVIDYKTESYTVTAKDCDLILEAVGPENFAPATATVKRGGAVIVIASGLPEMAERYGPTLGVVMLGLRLAGAIIRAAFRGVKFRAITRKPDGVALNEIGRLVDAGKIKPVIDSVFPLEEIVKAFERLETGRCRGKVVVSILD